MCRNKHFQSRMIPVGSFLNIFHCLWMFQLGMKPRILNSIRIELMGMLIGPRIVHPLRWILLRMTNSSWRSNMIGSLMSRLHSFLCLCSGRSCFRSCLCTLRSIWMLVIRIFQLQLMSWRNLRIRCPWIHLDILRKYKLRYGSKDHHHRFGCIFRRLQFDRSCKLSFVRKFQCLVWEWKYPSNQYRSLEKLSIKCMERHIFGILIQLEWIQLGRK